MEVVELFWDEIVDRFGQSMYIEDFDSDLLNPRNERHIWTLVDAEPYPVVMSGWHFVNRLAYYLFETPVEEDRIYVEVPDE